MSWIYIAFGAITVFGIIGVAYEEVRARLTQPKGTSPLSGLTFGDAFLLAGYLIPLLFGVAMAIHNVLT